MDEQTSDITHIAPKLDHKPEFQKVLQNYQPSPQAVEVLKNTPVIALNGPSSTGRNTVIRELLKTDDYYFIVSDTTRPPRYNDGVLEQNGREYYFRKETDLLSDLQQGRFIEAEIIHNQQVSGTSIREIEKAHELNKIAIADAEIEGVINLSRLKPDTIVVIFVPPSFDEWVLHRLNKRSKLGESELYNRFQTATKIFKLALPQENFHFVINDKLEDTVKYINDLKNGINDPVKEIKARRLAKELHVEIADYLKAHAPEIQPY